MLRQVYVLISGQVQGVGFRYATLEAARQIGVSGWVRNRRDGRVEATAEGTQAQLDQFIAFLRTGPPYARVTDLAIDWREATGAFHDFSLSA